LFLDFDGTLVEFADHPDDITPPAHLVPLLSTWQARLGGAIAIVSGRDMGSIDRFLSPLTLPVAGAHGMIRRGADGMFQSGEIDREALARIAELLDAFAADNAGTLVERKQHSVALHFRRVPHLQDAADSAMADAVAEADGFEVLRGKMVVEARSRAAGKGRAIDAFMGQPPFAGRVPVFAGDDVTDEDGFETVNRWNGLSIKVGGGATSAAYRLDGPAALYRWLRDSAETQQISAGV
jgi:trehalose 6-phosphate phosphatase